jgi:anti-sigma-K factor RskA
VNIKEYISSGIVESYVLGLASAEERKEFDQLCIQYPELVKARTDFEIALEHQALENAVAPPANLKNKIWQQISTTNEAKVVPMQVTNGAAKKTNWWKYAAAACVALLAGSLYWNLTLVNKNQSIQKEYDSSVARLGTLEKDMEVLRGSNPNIKMASMAGTPASPASYTTVYWDTASHDVYLLINNLPKPAADKEYQLWAFINNQPVDLGLIDGDYFIKQQRLLIKAKSAQKVEAFAITLEKKGRADISKPGGDVYVLGKL